MFLNINLAAAASPVQAAAASAASAGSSLVALSRASVQGLSTTVLSAPALASLSVDIYTLPALLCLATLLSLLVRRTLPFHRHLRLPKSMSGNAHTHFQMQMRKAIADAPMDAEWFAAALPLPPSPTSPVPTFHGAPVPAPLNLGRIANTQPKDQNVQFVWSNPRTRSPGSSPTFATSPTSPRSPGSPGSPSIPMVHTPQPSLSMAKLIMSRHVARKSPRQSSPRRATSSPPPSPPYQQMGFGARNPLSPKSP